MAFSSSCRQTRERARCVRLAREEIRRMRENGHRVRTEDAKDYFTGSSRAFRTN